MRTTIGRPATAWLIPLLLTGLLACDRRPEPTPTGPEAEATGSTAFNRGGGTMRAPLNPRLVEKGREIFRYDDFGDWRFWTGELGLNEVVQQLRPVDAVALGLKVDAEALPPAVVQAVLDDPSLLEDPAITALLLDLDAVVGIRAEVDEAGTITRLGVTCALCHSTVSDPPIPEYPFIGHRRDGWPNLDLEVGKILLATESPLLEPIEDYLATWDAGYYDARVNVDGRTDGPTVIPPAYGLHDVALETFTGDGPVSYWNAYVAVTQMRGQGAFSDPRIGVNVAPDGPNLVQPKLAALRAYQLSLEAPPVEGGFDPAAAERGRRVFEGRARCAGCHIPPTFTDAPRLHSPDEVPVEPSVAERSATGKYRTTPLRALTHHPPYFHDGSAATLMDVVERYDAFMELGLAAGQKADLVEYLKSL